MRSCFGQVAIELHAELEVRPAQVGAGEVGAFKARATQLGRGQRRPAQARIVERSVLEPGLVELCAVQAGFYELRPFETCPEQIGARQVRSVQAGPLPDSRPPEDSVSQICPAFRFPRPIAPGPRPTSGRRHQASRSPGRGSRTSALASSRGENAGRKRRTLSGIPRHRARRSVRTMPPVPPEDGGGAAGRLHRPGRRPASGGLRARTTRRGKPCALPPGSASRPDPRPTGRRRNRPRQREGASDPAGVQWRDRSLRRAQYACGQQGCARTPARESGSRAATDGAGDGGAGPARATMEVRPTTRVSQRQVAMRRVSHSLWAGMERHQA